MNRVKGKVAIVTGGSLGIGRAACIRLAEEGAIVAITDILDIEGKALADEISASGGKASYWHLNVADEVEVKTVIDSIASAFGSIHILVNNAGISGSPKLTHEVTETEWDALMSVNVKGPLFCTKHSLPYMMKQKSGSIINLSSIYGLIGAPDAPAYHASKGALRLMTKTDANIYASYNIRVNSIHPGFISTPMVENYLKTLPDPGAARAALEALHPLGHMGAADDIAWGIVYLASEESKFVTGSELVIDGGYTSR
ncbi:MAG TPA: glucose 1-dehydrogenase [Candidatus Kapabacteria bacterium]|nr:glucose 1-dehydrogenase [Candidatus Kapabacteria bacterium]